MRYKPNALANSVGLFCYTPFQDVLEAWNTLGCRSRSVAATMAGDVDCMGWSLLCFLVMGLNDASS